MSYLYGLNKASERNPKSKKNLQLFSRENYLNFETLQTELNIWYQASLAIPSLSLSCPSPEIKCAQLFSRENYLNFETLQT